MMTGCNNDDCRMYSSTTETIDGEEYCGKCARDIRLTETDDIAAEYGVGDDIGALEVLFESYIRDYTTSDGDGGFDTRRIERPAGVYVADKKVRGGTAVQRSDDLLRETAESLRYVAEKASGDYDVIGVGKNHDDAILIYIDTSDYEVRDPWFDVRDEWLEGTEFRGGTVMAPRSGWWKHKENTPRLDAPEFKERVLVPTQPKN